MHLTPLAVAIKEYEGFNKKSEEKSQMIKQFEEAMNDQKSRHRDKYELLDLQSSELEADLGLESQLTAQKRDEMLELKKELNLLDK